MRGAADFTLGSKVVCSDGVCGDLKRVILDPKTNVLTHLVVTPRHRRGTGRLVPLDLVAATVGDSELRCTRSEYQALESSVETEFLPAPAADGAYGAGNVFRAAADYVSTSRRAVPQRSSATGYPSAKWRYAAGSRCTQRTVRSGASVNW